MQLLQVTVLVTESDWNHAVEINNVQFNFSLGWL